MKNELIRRTDNCLNCGVEISKTSNFCPQCGQKNDTLKLSMGIIVKDFASDYFSFDSKLIKSVVPLLIKPGYLTTEFCSGKRATFIHPIRLYLFISFIYFFIFSLDFKTNDSKSGVILNSGNEISFDIGDDKISYNSTSEFRDAIEHKGLDHYLDSLKADSRFERLMVTQIYRISKSDSKSVMQYFTQNASVLMFFLLPIFAGLLFLFFRKSDYYYVEHLMHSIHIHSFIFLIFSLFSLIFYFDDVDYAVLILFILITAYTIKSLLKVYGNTTKRTIWKFLGLITVYNFVIILGLATMLFVSLALF